MCCENIIRNYNLDSPPKCFVFICSMTFILHQLSSTSNKYHICDIMLNCYCMIQSSYFLYALLNPSNINNLAVHTKTFYHNPLLS